MSWLLKSSIGRKFLMALSGLCLVLFLLFHMCMNLVSIIDMESYEMICGLLGINWYALVGTAVIAALILFHIIYAICLTLQNQKARGNSKYAISATNNSSWSSKNMFVLGIVVLAFLLMHLYDFWFKMMFSELFNLEGAVHPHEVRELLMNVFESPVRVALYVIGIVALWIHLSHGIWSMFQSTGLNGRTWYPRVKCIGQVFAAVISIGFLIVPIFFFAKTLLA